MSEHEEIQELKHKATALGMPPVSPNIGLATLRKKVADFEAALDADMQGPEVIVKECRLTGIGGASDRELERLQRIKRNGQRHVASEQMFVMVSPLNPAESALRGRIISGENDIVREKKWVEFHTKWKIPRILYNVLKEATFVKHVPTKIGNVDTHKPMVVPAYNVQILPPPTEAEIKEIKERQILQNSVG